MSSEFVPARHFDRWVGAWDEIHSSMPDIAPFLESRFLVPLLSTFGTGKEFVVFGRQEDKPSFAAIFTRTSPAFWMTYQPSQLPLGPVVATPSFTWSNLRSQVAASLPGPVASLAFTQLDPALLSRPSDNGCLDAFPTAWVDVEGSFEVYWAARGKNLRHNLRKQRARLSEAGVKPRLECITDPKDIASAIADYGRLEAAGWKGEIGTAVRPDSPQAEFYRSMLEAFMKIGKARIWRYWFDSSVVAVDLCIEGGGTLVILKTTYDENQKQYSPAFLMREEAFRTVFDEGRIRRIEFFGRRMEWHERWTDNVRVLYHANFDRWPMLSLLRRRSIGGERQAGSH